MAVHRKLLAMMLIVSGAALLLASVASMAYQYSQFRTDLARNAATSATLILANTRPSVSFNDPEDAHDTLATLTASSHLRLACLYLSTGELFAGYRPHQEEPGCPPSPPPVGHRFSATNLELVQRDIVEGRPTEWLLLRNDLNLLMVRLRTQALITTLVFCAALFLAYVLSLSLQSLVSDPVVELASLARGVSVTGDYSRRAVKRSDDEIGVLAESFNQMLERVTAAEAEREGALAREREANRTKDEFLATLSHELRTPLGAILGWAQLLRRKIVPVEEMERGLERIERNAHSQNRLINDLLDISRILSGKLSLHRQPADLVAIARVILDSLAPLAQSRRVSLHADWEEPKMLALIDTDRISQVLSNLLSNALKFTPPEGEVRVTIRRAGEMQEIAVSDTGAGIAPDFLPRLFEPFRQADASHTRAHGGLGLGLAIARRITDMHGGDISAESAGIGQGAVFRVRLPAAVEVPRMLGPGSGSAGDSAGVPDLSPYSILVVDDDQDSRDLVVSALGSAGAHAMSAASADEAIALALDAPPDVLITDIAMPHIDGYTLKARLEQQLKDRMPGVVIALSAFAAEADARRSIELGFDAHITKPFDADFLLATIHEQLMLREAGVRMPRR